MAHPALRILQALHKSGDSSLEELAALIPKKYGDHRDFYVLASCIARGLIDDPFISSHQSLDPASTKSKEQLLAWQYFAMSTADRTATYKNHTWSIHGVGETLKSQRFALSGLGMLFLEERTLKRFDRAFAIGSGILVGIVVAVAAVLIERYAKGGA
jgi:hypothetical protein